jgi:hypothetical protein
MKHIRRLILSSLLLSACCIPCGYWSAPSAASPLQPSTEHAAAEARKLLGQVISAYCGKDLREFDEQGTAVLLTKLTRLIPKRNYRPAPPDFRPWYIWEFKKGTEPPLYVLFEDYASLGHPNSPHVRFTVLDRFGRTLSEENFHIGWRCYFKSVRLEQSVNGQFPLLIFEPARGGLGYSVPQVYARINDRFDLIRVEHSDGTVARNDYCLKLHPYGPALPRQSAADWEVDLASGDRARILRALVWLGGVHLDLKPGEQPDAQHEDPQDVHLVREVRARAMVAARLRYLAESEDLWLRDAARLALNPEDSPLDR